MKKFFLSIALVLLNCISLFAEDKIEVFPSVRYEQFIVYQNLVIFWIAIIGLIIIIRMKLREIERIQKMGINKEEKDIPLLD